MELSFIPYKLAARPDLQSSWYHPNVSPPRDYAKWDDLVTQFTKHLADRYGIDEAANWYFEVWNEPNLDSWSEVPKRESYFELYDHTARDIKAVSPKLRVGGPATAQAAWIPAMIQHAVQKNVPLDFVSTHVYGNNKASDVFHISENIPRDQVVCRSVKDGARPDPGVIATRAAAYLERLQCHLRQQRRCNRLHIHGTVAGRYHRPV